MVSSSQARPSRWLELASASGLRFLKPSQAIKPGLQIRCYRPLTHWEFTLGKNTSNILIRGKILKCEKQEKIEIRAPSGISGEAMAQARAKPGQAKIAGPGPGFRYLKPEPDEAKPKPWFPSQAKPAHH
ncbi:hypothetical protein B0H11DRAFT_1909890 [Mycena galericulata]|nr:hypothetical protein B0H11DRAFT_1909890 [Mycena galericulata]